MPDPDLDARIGNQRAVIAELERALWDGGLNESLLPGYQAAFRALEALRDLRAESSGRDDRHHFVMVMPVADDPEQARACLASLLELCQAFAYGGHADGRWRKVSVLLADDSRDPAAIRRHQEIGAEFNALGLTTLYFGQEAQLALMDQLADLDLDGIVGRHERGQYSHKGQAAMRNIAYLKLARMHSSLSADSPPLLYYSLDPEQAFRVNAPTARGDRELCAVSHLHHLDEIFHRTDALVLTGKGVGDPPVSPAVMAGNFLDDVLAFLDEMTASEPRQPYRQPITSPRGSGAAAYHDMADLFGFNPALKAFRYRCPLADASDNAACFGAFAGELSGFFHGRHPTRVTWYRPDAEGVLAGARAARTVYTDNYVFRPQALRWFIPFAPLRLRMSGPAMGRLLKAELDGRFVSANLPLLHRRALGPQPVAGAPARAGSIAIGADIGAEASSEWPRQFLGDVLLFTLEHLTDLGFPAEALPDILVGQTLDTVRAEMGQKYRDHRHQALARLEQLNARLDDPRPWWNQAPDLAEARAQLRAFADRLARDFSHDPAGHAGMGDDPLWRDWRPRLLAAINRFQRDRRAWTEALARLRAGAGA